MIAKSVFTKVPAWIQTGSHYVIRQNPLSVRRTQIVRGLLASAFLITAISPIEAQESKLSSFVAIDTDANLLEYPKVRPFKMPGEKQYTLGDLHGNALKLFYFLIKEDLIAMSPGDYNTFCQIYYKRTESVTKQDLKCFDEILARIEYRKITNGGMVRLLGDEFCDRGENDYYVLKILEALKAHQVPFEVLFSNHGYELISCFEKGLMEHMSYLETVDCGASLTHLRDFIKKDLVSYKEVERLIKEVYYPNLKLLSYTTQKEEGLSRFTLYSHAPIGLKTVQMLAFHRLFALNMDFSQTYGWGSTIDKVNAKFQAYLKQGLITYHFDHEIHNRSPVDKIPFSLPVRRCVWSRGFVAQDEPVKELEGVLYTYVHGHDGCGVVDEKYKGFVVNLDNLLGKGRGNEARTYSVHVSSETSKLE